MIMRWMQEGERSEGGETLDTVNIALQHVISSNPSRVSEYSRIDEEGGLLCC